MSDALPLHPLEFRILLVLLDGPAHGYRVVKEIEAGPHHGTLYPANLYRRIRDLRDRGLLEEASAPPDAAEEDGRRRYFQVTEAGRSVARAEARRLRELLVEADRHDLLEPV